MVTKPITAVLLIGGISLFSSSELKAQNVKTINDIREQYLLDLLSNGNVHMLKPTSNCKQQGKKAAYNLGKTDIGVQYGQYNSFENDFAFN